MGDKPDLEDTVRQILDSRGVAVLATQGGDYPHVCLVAFVASPDLRNLFFVTGRSTRKFQNIKRDSKVMLLVDDRANTLEDFDGATVITGRGSAVPVDTAHAHGTFSSYLRRHPHLETFARDKSSVLVKVEIDSYAVVTRFQEVMVLEMGTEPGKP